MSNAIQFLESLGASPASASRDAEAYARALSMVDLDEAQHHALIGRDAGALAKLLDGRSRMLCMIVAPDEEEQEEEPDHSEEEGDEPAKRDDERSAAAPPV